MDMRTDTFNADEIYVQSAIEDEALLLNFMRSSVFHVLNKNITRDSGAYINMHRSYKKMATVPIVKYSLLDMLRVISDLNAIVFVRTLVGSVTSVTQRELPSFTWRYCHILTDFFERHGQIMIWPKLIQFAHIEELRNYVAANAQTIEERAIPIPLKETEVDAEELFASGVSSARLTEFPMIVEEKEDDNDLDYSHICNVK